MKKIIHITIAVITVVSFCTGIALLISKGIEKRDREFCKNLQIQTLAKPDFDILMSQKNFCDYYSIFIDAPTIDNTQE